MGHDAAGLTPTVDITRTGPTTFDVEVFEWQQEMLANLVEQLRDLLLEGSSPLLRRLYPTAYPDDAEADAKYGELVRDQLLESHLSALDTLERTSATAAPVPMTDAELGQWMQAINSVRLILGTRLDVSEDDEPDDLDEDDPDYALHAVYDVLSVMLDLIVRALTETLPPPRVS